MLENEKPVLILTVRSESTWTWDGPITNKLQRLPDGSFRIISIKKFSEVEMEAHKCGRFLRTVKKPTKNKILPLLERLQNSKISAFPKHEMGCDGGFTELEIGGYAGKALYRWWISPPPAGWEILGEVAENIFKLSGIYDKLTQL